MREEKRLMKKIGEVLSKERNTLSAATIKKRDWQRRREQEESETSNRNVFEHLV